MPLLKRFEEKGSTLTPLKGEQPSAPLKGIGVIPINNTFQVGTYQNYVVDVPESADRTNDLTAFSATQA